MHGACNMKEEGFHHYTTYACICDTQAVMVKLSYLMTHDHNNTL